MRYACMIPARLQSSRFPRKMLAMLGDKPLLQWVWEAAHAAERFDEIVFAVDDEEIARLVQSFGGKVHMTSKECLSGTARMVELLKTGRLDADVCVCWQGDEPFIEKKMVDELLQTSDTGDADVWTLKKRIVDPEHITSIQYAKVVTDVRGYALLFSRSPIPCYRDETPAKEKVYYKHVGIYAYAKDTIHKIGDLQPTTIEFAEQLEQLRWLYHGLKVLVHETYHEVQGIDLQEHLVLAEELVRKSSKDRILSG